ncbi:MAG: LPP20 family lipoprotein [Gammaproteobacteria bacterium]|nr:LPP20 family lipoprotein [Gammaproteobacteria bacterium]
MKNNIFLKSVWIAGLLFISQMVYSDSRPGWIDAEPENYPHEKYISATGSASKPELAKDRALANLVKIFELKIHEQSTTRSDTQVNVKDGEERVTKSDRLEQQISVHTDKVIDGARIAATWLDEDVFTYHALAVLDRKQAGNNIRQEMSRLDDETEIELAQSKAQTNALRKMVNQEKALQYQKQRLGLQKMLKVIDLSGQGRSSLWRLAELDNQLDTALLALQVSAMIDNDPIGGLDQALESAMGNAGFPAMKGSGDYALVASLDVQDLGKREGWYWLRGKLTLKLVESSSGKVIGRQQWPLKVSALQRNETDARLMTQVSKTLNNNLKAVILSFATGKQEQ